MSMPDKVQASHLKRGAYLYVRQSTLQQVLENTESTERQYALRQRAVALGWPLERIVVIDTDLGHSGASYEDREGFQQLVAEVGMAVQQELEQRLDEADRLRQQRVARARYEADLAQQRFMQVDPKNRLVADSLEADWNDRLRALAEAQEEYEQQSQADRVLLDEQSRERIRSLATDFPRLWNDPNTPDRERKRMIRLLIEDVTLRKQDDITANVRFKGGSHQTVVIPRPLRAWEIRQTDAEVVTEIDRLLNDHTIGQLAGILNERGFRSGEGCAFTNRIVARLCREYRLKSRHDRLREAGKLTQAEIAEQLHVTTTTVKVWRRHGLLRGYPYNDKNECLYDPPDHAAPAKSQGRKLSERRRFPEVVSLRTNEVQHAT